MLPLLFGGAALAGAAWYALLRKPSTGPAVPDPVASVADPVLDPIAAIVPPPAAHDDLVLASSIQSTIAAMADPANMVPVEYQGETWLVAPQPIGPVGIGEALALATGLGLKLPSPGLVDAIWRAADLQVIPPIRSSDGTPATMSSPAVYDAQKKRIDALVGDRPFTLLAGTHKDVVMGDATSGPGLKAGKPGLYGWMTDQPQGALVDQNGHGAGVPLHTPVTPGPGKVVQQPFGGHGLDWKDYSQSLRLVRKA